MCVGEAAFPSCLIPGGVDRFTGAHAAERGWTALPGRMLPGEEVKLLSCYRVALLCETRAVGRCRGVDSHLGESETSFLQQHAAYARQRRPIRTATAVWCL